MNTEMVLAFFWGVFLALAIIGGLNVGYFRKKTAELKRENARLQADNAKLSTPAAAQVNTPAPAGYQPGRHTQLFQDLSQFGLVPAQQPGQVWTCRLNHQSPAGSPACVVCHAPFAIQQPVPQQFTPPQQIPAPAPMAPQPAPVAPAASPIPAGMKQCSRCGQPAHSQQKFCNHCGNTL